ncbi:MAG: hypothetical protein QOH98_826 [Methylobacteriaceae bacterium]|jgi:glutathione S-transferase|nr:hypothetical protein [Methylobacteriaceae bacterium]
MITLYTFGPYFGLPDGSPFVTKAMLLLKLAGLPYKEDRKGYSKAPKGKLPYIDDDGTRIADSTFIRLHIEKKYGSDFDAGLSSEQRAIAWAVEKMCEEHLYLALIYGRWFDDKNFENGPAQFFEAVPAPMRPIVKTMIRRKVRNNLRAHGFGKHSPSEVDELATRDIDALATILDGKQFICGDRPCGADATVFAFVAGVLTPNFEMAARRAAEAHPNLVAYRDRMMRTYFPDHAGARA